MASLFFYIVDDPHLPGPVAKSEPMQTGMDTREAPTQGHSGCMPAFQQQKRIGDLKPGRLRQAEQKILNRAPAARRLVIFDLHGIIS